MENSIGQPIVMSVADVSRLLEYNLYGGWVMIDKRKFLLVDRITEYQRCEKCGSCGSEVEVWNRDKMHISRALDEIRVTKKTIRKIVNGGEL